MRWPLCACVEQISAFHEATGKLLHSGDITRADGRVNPVLASPKVIARLGPGYGVPADEHARVKDELLRTRLQYAEERLASAKLDQVSAGDAVRWNCDLCINERCLFRTD